MIDVVNTNTEAYVDPLADDKFLAKEMWQQPEGHEQQKPKPQSQASLTAEES